MNHLAKQPPHMSETQMAVGKGGQVDVSHGSITHFTGSVIQVPGQASRHSVGPHYSGCTLLYRLIENKSAMWDFVKSEVQL